MRLILARHGNTFGPGDKVVWVGARSDLPLTPAGKEQALAIGEALKANAVTPSRVIAGPLTRTKETAALIMEAAKLAAPAVEIDDRLTEIDYGRWEGKSSDEIRALYPGELEGWEERQEWPEQAGWRPELASLKARIGEFLKEIPLPPLREGLGEGKYNPSVPESSPPQEREGKSCATILIVSSNGIFRLLGEMLAPGLSSYKMATGNLSVVEMAGAGVHKVSWNLKPAEFGPPE